MARIRSIKPEIRKSELVTSWPFDIRWTFVGLPGYCDDHGRGHDNALLIKAELYPLEENMTARKIERHLEVIARGGPLCRYTVAGKNYLHLVNWTEHQRPSHPAKSSILPCPLHESSGESREDYVRTPEGLRPEQGAGSREQGSGVASSASLSVVTTNPDPIQDPHPDDLAALVAAIQAHRTDWPKPIITKAVEIGLERASWPRTVAALIAVAADPATTVPSRISVDGFWWNQPSSDPLEQIAAFARKTAS